MSIDTIVYEKQSKVTGIALLEKGRLQEIEIVNEAGAVSGDVYLGKVSRKVALANDKEGFFVNIGLENDGFLNAEEFGVTATKLTEGQSIVVQVSQEKRAEKNAKLARAVQLVGNYLVYCPYRMNVEASSKIEDKATVSEYIDKVKEHMTGQEGWILRTSSVEVGFAEVAKEMDELRNIYESIRVKARTAHAPSLLYGKPDPVWDYVAKNAQNLHNVVVNNHNVEKELAERYGDKFEVVYNANPFEEYGVDEAIGEALEQEVALKGGGRIIIEETRACVAIDVDSGKDVGGGSVSRINEEAAYEIAHQIRLRNLAGKIVIDFAGHTEYKFMKPVIEILETELAKDSIKGHVAGLSRSGLVEVIRTRRRPSLLEVTSSVNS